VTTIAGHTPTVLEAHAQRVAQCSSCKAPIVWFKTAKGNNMPVNAETVSPTDTVLELPRHISHFATCPNSAKHRKPKG
jgi:hypothetical protein